MVRLVWTKTFAHTAKRFLKKDPGLKKELERTLKQLEDNPSHPKLRLHPLRGKLAGKRSVSLTYSYRIVLILALSEGEIILLDIGSHGDVYHP